MTNFIKIDRPSGKREQRRPTVAMQRAFTLIEMLTVIAIIAILAAVGVGLSGVASRKARESNTRAQLDQLITAIDSYHNDLNQYPPDGAVAGQNINSGLNTLYYELLGTASANQGADYRVAGNPNLIPATAVQSVFHVQGFRNSVVAPAQPKGYLTGLKASQWHSFTFSSAPTYAFQLLIAPVNLPPAARATSPLAGLVTDTRQLQYNPWHYVSTGATNNPGRYDLWAEYYDGSTKKIVANWNQ